MIVTHANLMHSRILPNLITINDRIRFVYSRKSAEKFLSDAYLSLGLNYETVYKLSTQTQLVLLGAHVVLPSFPKSVSVILTDHQRQMYWSDADFISDLNSIKCIRETGRSRVPLEVWGCLNKQLGNETPCEKTFKYFGDLKSKLVCLPIPRHRLGYLIGELSFNSLDNFDMRFSFIPKSIKG